MDVALGVSRCIQIICGKGDVRSGICKSSKFGSLSEISFSFEWIQSYVEAGTLINVLHTYSTYNIGVS